MQKENSEAAGKAHESYVIQPGDTSFSDKYGQIRKYRSHKSDLQIEWDVSGRNHLSGTSNCITLENCAIINGKNGNLIINKMKVRNKVKAKNGKYI